MTHSSDAVDGEALAEQPAADPAARAASTGGGWPVDRASELCVVASEPTMVVATGVGSAESAEQAGAVAGVDEGGAESVVAGSTAGASGTGAGSVTDAAATSWSGGVAAGAGDAAVGVGATAAVVGAWLAIASVAS